MSEDLATLKLRAAKMRRACDVLCVESPALASMAAQRLAALEARIDDLTHASV